MKQESRVVSAATECSLGITSVEGFNRLISEVSVGTKRSFKSKSSQCHWQLQNQVIRKWSGEPSCPWRGQTGKIAKEEGHLCSQSGEVWLGKEEAHKTGPWWQETLHMAF